MPQTSLHRHGTTLRSKLAPHAAAVAISNAPLPLLDGQAAGLQGLRDLHSVSPPTRTFRSVSASKADSSSSTPAAIAMSKDLSSPAMIGLGVGSGGVFGVAEGEEEMSGLGSIPDVSASASASRAVRAMNVGQGVPVVRRHSYTTGMGPKPRFVWVRWVWVGACFLH